MTPVRTWPVAGLAFGVLWTFVRGPDPTVDALVGQLLFGSVVGLPLAFVFRRLYSERIDLEHVVRSIPAALLYVATFTREIVVANVDVAYRVLVPGVTIEPEVILIPLRVRTPFGITTIANSITLTPGTVTLDYEEEENALFVHVIDGRDPGAVVEPIRTWEDYALVVFDEELGPDDPAEPISIDAGGKRDREYLRRIDADRLEGTDAAGDGVEDADGGGRDE
ncbi:Na+/H+ antiporter subunit E [Halalkalicoccus ordinarius]|uniref:Na+/H+ antiporter subunit E n=1 Tax=Halalkalicoccus ordinarius TaxID=3116651 RepID=UPI00300EB8A7